MTIYIKTEPKYNRIISIFNELNVEEGAVEITDEQHQEIMDLWPNVQYTDGIVSYLNYYALISLTEVKTVKMYEINSQYETAVNSVKADTPPSEVDTWTKQELEAKAWLLNNETATPFVDILALARGVDRLELLSKILVKAEAFANALASLTGQRQRFEDLVIAATSNDEVTGIVVSYKL